MNFLITSGATREPIDQVRFITNMSTGKTGASLAESLAKSGHKVTYLHGQGALVPNSSMATVEYSSFSDLDEKIQGLLKENNFDVVIHAAAVSDFSISAIRSPSLQQDLMAKEKLPSDERLQIELKPNFKILNQIKNYSKRSTPLVVGFKLTFTESPSEQQEAVRRLFDGGNVDYVVHNDLKDIRENNRHIFRVHSPNECLEQVDSVNSLAKKFIAIAEERT